MVSDNSWEWLLFDNIWQEAVSLQRLQVFPTLLVDAFCIVSFATDQLLELHCHCDCLWRSWRAANSASEVPFFQSNAPCSARSHWAWHGARTFKFQVSWLHSRHWHAIRRIGTSGIALIWPHCRLQLIWRLPVPPFRPLMQTHTHTHMLCIPGWAYRLILVASQHNPNISQPLQDGNTTAPTWLHVKGQISFGLLSLSHTLWALSWEYRRMLSHVESMSSGLWKLFGI